MNDDPRGFYCLAPGVLFWEKTAAARSSFSTLTVGARDLSELAIALAGVLESFESVVRWHTALYDHWSSRLQQLRVRQQMEKDPGGFSETVVSDAGEIFTNARRFVGTLALAALAKTFGERGADLLHDRDEVAAWLESIAADLPYRQ